MYKQSVASSTPRGKDGLSSAWSQVAVFAAAVDASLGKWLGERYGVGLTEYRALVQLAKAPDKELRVNDLAQRVALNQSSVTRLLARLESKDLTRREVCMEDGRGVYAVVTEEGERVVRKAAGPYEKRVRELLSGVAEHFPQVEAGRLERALADLGELIAP